MAIVGLGFRVFVLCCGVLLLQAEVRILTAGLQASTLVSDGSKGEVERVGV